MVKDGSYSLQLQL